MRDRPGPSLYMPPQVYQTLSSFPSRDRKPSQTYFDENPDQASETRSSFHSRNPRSSQISFDEMYRRASETRSSVHSRNPRSSQMSFDEARGSEIRSSVHSRNERPSHTSIHENPVQASETRSSVHSRNPRSSQMSFDDMPATESETRSSVHSRNPRSSQMSFDETHRRAPETLSPVHSRNPRSSQMTFDENPAQASEIRSLVYSRNPGSSEISSDESDVEEELEEVPEKVVSKRKQKIREQKRENIYKKMGKDIYEMFGDYVRDAMLLDESYFRALTENQNKFHKKRLKYIEDLDLSPHTYRNFRLKSIKLRLKHETEIQKLEAQKSRKEKCIDNRLNTNIDRRANVYHSEWKKYYKDIQDSVPEKYQVEQIARDIHDEIFSLRSVLDEQDHTSEIEELSQRLKEYMKETLKIPSFRIMIDETGLYHKMLQTIKRVAKSRNKEHNKILTFTCARDYSSTELTEKCRRDRTAFYLMSVDQIVDLYVMYKGKNPK